MVPQMPCQHCQGGLCHTSYVKLEIVFFRLSPHAGGCIVRGDKNWGEGPRTYKIPERRDEKERGKEIDDLVIPSTYSCLLIITQRFNNQVWQCKHAQPQGYACQRDTLQIALFIKAKSQLHFRLEIAYIISFYLSLHKHISLSPDCRLQVQTEHVGGKKTILQPSAFHLQTLVYIVSLSVVESLILGYRWVLYHWDKFSYL